MIKKKEKMKKCIAFHLPQFHEVPENDEWWGKGFTEWTNVKAAKPLFEEHYQPKVPLGEEYYNLLDKKVLLAQAKMAKKHGIYGFCYYHYWFKNGKKLLEKPAEMVLENEDIDIPFCFSWANENWARTWDGGNNEVLMLQEYGGKEEWKAHLEYLLKFFLDDRYIKIEGKPLLILYRPDIIPKLNEMLVFWKREVKKHNLPGIYIMSQHPAGYFSTRYDSSNIENFIMFEPQFTRAIIRGKDVVNTEKRRRFFAKVRKVHLMPILNWVYNRKKQATLTERSENLEVNDYDFYWNKIIKRNTDNTKLVLGAFVDWDNTARKRNGMLFKGASPKKFGVYMKQLFEKHNDMEFAFINAWNEWGEGAYLEPDELHRYAYLEELAKRTRA